MQLLCYKFCGHKPGARLSKGAVTGWGAMRVTHAAKLPPALGTRALRRAQTSGGCYAGNALGQLNRPLHALVTVNVLIFASAPEQRQAWQLLQMRAHHV